MHIFFKSLGNGISASAGWKSMTRTLNAAMSGNTRKPDIVEPMPPSEEPIRAGKNRNRMSERLTRSLTMTKKKKTW